MAEFLTLLQGSVQNQSRNISKSVPKISPKTVENQLINSVPTVQNQPKKSSTSAHKINPKTGQNHLIKSVSKQYLLTSINVLTCMKYGKKLQNLSRRCSSGLVAICRVSPLLVAACSWSLRLAAARRVRGASSGSWGLMGLSLLTSLSLPSPYCPNSFSFI